jgi:exopolyphosphatase/pppGpp-phosphohydrolase
VARVIRRTASVTVSRADLERVLEVVAGSPADELVRRHGVNRRRASQLAAGAALMEALLVRYGLSAAAVSPASLRDGAILAATVAGDLWPDRLVELVSAPRRAMRAPAPPPAHP